MALEEMGRLDDAFVFFNRHAELAFGAPASQAEPPQQAVSLANRSAGPARPDAQLQADPATDTLFREALKYHQAGKLAEAESLYRQVLAARPGLAEAHVN